MFQPPHFAGDCWMYPYQRTPMGNPYVFALYTGYLLVTIPKNPLREHQLNTMGVRTYVR